MLTGVDASHRFAVPDCLMNGPVITNVFLNFMAIDNVTYFPSSVTTFTASGSSFGAALSGSLAGTGFDSNGQVVWDDFWAALPNVASFNIMTSSLRGSLPAALPINMGVFTLSQTGITGPIPSTMLSSILSPASTINSLTVNIYDCLLGGTIPGDLFEGFETSNLGSLVVQFQQTSLSGSIPPNLLQPLQGMRLGTFKLALNTNDLTGSLPDKFFPIAAIRSDCSFFWDVSFNGLTGTIPPTLFGNVTAFNSFEFHAQSNKLSGSLPNALFSNGWTALPVNNVFVLQLMSNELSGTIPERLLTGGLNDDASFITVSLFLTNNSFTGTVPSLLSYTAPPQSPAGKKRTSEGADELADAALTGASTVCITVSFHLFIYFDLNQLTGPLPSDFFSCAGLTSDSFQVVFDLSTNPINGTIPASLFAPIPDLHATSSMQVFLDTTLISGSPPAICFANTVVSWYLSDTRLNGSIPATWGSCSGFSWIDLSLNPNLTGSIPAGLLTVPYLSFFAQGTGLNGPIPTTIAPTLRTLSLSNTNIDFCSSVSSSPITSSTTTCSMRNTNACTCSSYYTRCDVDVPCASPRPPPTPIPSASPVASPSPPPPPTGCSPKTRPSLDFECVNGLWTAGSTNTSTLTIPSGAGTVLVTGNLTSTTIVIQGIGSTINVTGSVTNLTSVTVELTPQQIDALNSNGRTLQVLITGGNGSDLSSVAINTKATSGCKKVKAQKVLLDGGHTLGAYFSVDKSGCNTWWIILVSVIVAVVVVAAVVLVLLAVFYKPFRHAVRPYAGSQSRQTGGF